MALLIIILACCVIGVTIFQGERAWPLLFNTLWFNGIPVLLVSMWAGLAGIIITFIGRMRRGRKSQSVVSDQ